MFRRIKYMFWYYLRWNYWVNIMGLDEDLVINNKKGV